MRTPTFLLSLCLLLPNMTVLAKDTGTSTNSFSEIIKRPAAPQAPAFTLGTAAVPAAPRTMVSPFNNGHKKRSPGPEAAPVRSTNEAILIPAQRHRRDLLDTKSSSTSWTSTGPTDAVPPVPPMVVAVSPPRKPCAEPITQPDPTPSDSVTDTPAKCSPIRMCDGIYKRDLVYRRYCPCRQPDGVYIYDGFYGKRSAST